MKIQIVFIKLGRSSGGPTVNKLQTLGYDHLGYITGIFLSTIEIEIVKTNTKNLIFIKKKNFIRKKIVLFMTSFFLTDYPFVSSI